MTRVLLLIPALMFAGCATAGEPQLHELPRAEAPYWSVVSLKGLDEAMRDFYDSGVAIPGMANSEQAEQFKKVDFDAFKKVNGDLRIYEENGRIISSYQTCNGAAAEYESNQSEWLYLTQKQAMVACSRRIPIGDGTFVVGAGNQNLSENVFLKNAPDVTGYAVSEDGQTLTLLSAVDEALGVFSYKGMTR